MELTRLRPAAVVPRREERLTPSERIRVGVEIVAAYALARWWLVRLDFPASVHAARDVRPAAASNVEADETATAVRLGLAVQRALRPLPLDTRCLVRALVLTRLLARRGISSTFVLGVRAKPAFAAHAWLERGGVPLLPTGPEFERLTEL